ncbi:MAG TPA: glutamate 5-kinase [Caulobacteraceae bacterium]|jgi:glutamate 5-kinase|nr:glutamate 5-kinase [Caulobacteraceae bacterium]
MTAASGLLTRARRVVVKVGSSLLVDGQSGAADRAWLAALARDAARLKARTCEVLIVSSGSVALGRRRLGLGSRALSLEEKQAAAAAGQSLLMRAWEEAFEPYGAAVAQVLVTRDDTEIRRRWLNARATMETLLGLGAVPIVNENDTVATEEIRYGDNDRLAARVAQMIGADLLILLSDIDGLYTADPRRDRGAVHIPLVSDITPEIEAMGGGRNEDAGMGSGGMATKLAAARIAHGAGCATLITLGRRSDSAAGPLEAVEQGARATVFEPHATPAAAYKQWIGGTLAPQGVLTVDAGAAAALRAGKSLLPAGVRGVDGGFGKGDAVTVVDEAGREIARGLAAYGADEARAIQGRRSDAIEKILGYAGRPVLIHRNDLVLVAG